MIIGAVVALLSSLFVAERRGQRRGRDAQKAKQEIQNAKTRRELNDIQDRARRAAANASKLPNNKDKYNRNRTND